MINLIKNELAKIMKKRGFYVKILLILGIVLFTNFMYSYISTVSFDSNMNYWEEQLAKLEAIGETNSESYVEIKTQLEVEQLATQFDKKAWQQTIIQNKLYNEIYNKNIYSYLEKNQEKAEEAEKLCQSMVEQLHTGDWKYFAQTELQEKLDIKNVLEQEKNTVESYNQADLESQIYRNEKEIENLQLRLEKEISYEDTFLNQALDGYLNNQLIVYNYEQKENLEYQDKLDYQNAVEKMNLSFYVIQNNQDILNDYNARGILLDFYNQYGIFIILIVILIAAPMISEEFNKGTIKLLLVRPHSRIKIWIAKFLAVLIMLLLTIMIMLIMQFLIGGIMFGFSSYGLPAVQYDFNLGQIVTMNIFSSLLLQTMATLPLYILLGTIAFVLSTLFTNTGLAMGLTFVLYIFGSAINSLAILYKLTFLKYFITLNWNLEQYLFGRLPQIEFVSFGFSAVICLVYFITLLIVGMSFFKKRNIKNI